MCKIEIGRRQVVVLQRVRGDVKYTVIWTDYSTKSITVNAQPSLVITYRENEQNFYCMNNEYLKKWLFPLYYSLST